MNSTKSKTIPKITKYEFLNATMSELAALTGIPSERFSEWNAGKRISEEKVIQIAKSINVTPGTVLDWIIQWRLYDPNDITAPWNVRNNRERIPRTEFPRKKAQ